MKRMGGWAIGLSLISALVCGPVMAQTASGSTKTSVLNTDPVEREPFCFVLRTPDSGWVTLVCSPNDGYDALQGLFCIYPFCGPTISHGTT